MRFEFQRQLGRFCNCKTLPRSIQQALDFQVIVNLDLWSNLRLAMGAALAIIMTSG